MYAPPQKPSTQALHTMYECCKHTPISPAPSWTLTSPLLFLYLQILVHCSSVEMKINKTFLCETSYKGNVGVGCAYLKKKEELQTPLLLASLLYECCSIAERGHCPAAAVNPLWGGVQMDSTPREPAWARPCSWKSALLCCNLFPPLKERQRSLFH